MDPLQETVTSLDVQALSPAMVVLVLSSKLWMLMDPTEEGPGPPLVAATHKHRPIRGGVKTASFSAAYPPAMCVDFAKFYHHCMQGLARGKLLASPLSKYEEPREWPELGMKEIRRINELSAQCQSELSQRWEVQPSALLSKTPRVGRATARKNCLVLLLCC